MFCEVQATKFCNAQKSLQSQNDQAEADSLKILEFIEHHSVSWVLRLEKLRFF